MSRILVLVLLAFNYTAAADQPVECRFDFDNPVVAGFPIQSWDEFSGIETFNSDGNSYAINYGRLNSMGTVEVIDTTNQPAIIHLESVESQDVFNGGTDNASFIRRTVYRQFGEFKIIGSSSMNFSGGQIGTTWIGSVSNSNVHIGDPNAASLAGVGLTSAFTDGNTELQVGVEGNEPILQIDRLPSVELENSFIVGAAQRASSDSRFLGGVMDGNVLFWDANNRYSLSIFSFEPGANALSEPDFVRYLEFDSRFGRYVALLDYPRTDGLLQTALGLWSLDEANQQCDFVAEFGLGSTFIDADTMGDTIIFGYEIDGTYFVSGTDFTPVQIPFSFVALSYNSNQNALYINGGKNGLWVYQGVQLGDINQDGVVNLLDVAPFIALLTTGQFQVEADLNGDGVVNLLDVSPFVDLLSGG